MTSDIRNFRTVIMDYHRRHGRDLPWRQAEADGSFDPYKILVSEMMLQQTQVQRVIPKYYEFLERFPTIEALAQSPLGEVLKTWNGLGYNRRAKYMWQLAQVITANHEGKVPDTLDALVRLPGIGPNTAGAILAYAYNQPAVFIETNIRTVFIHHFFSDRSAVSDEEILEVLMLVVPSREEQPDEAIYSLPGAMKGSPAREDPGWGRVRNPEGVSHYREFYQALMDYGTHLKTSIGNAAKQSTAYKKQSAFHGSRRQIRGIIIRALIEQSCTLRQLQKHTRDIRLKSVLDDLERENIIHRSNYRYQLL